MSPSPHGTESHGTASTTLASVLAAVTSAASSSSSSHDHGSSSSSSSASSGGGHGGMSVAFHVNYSDNLFSFVPTTAGHYAGIIIFLIVLAMVFRGLLAAKSIMEHVWAKKAERLNSSTVLVVPVEEKGPDGQVFSRTISGGEEGALQPVRRNFREEGWGRPFRFSTELPRAALGVVIAGVGYLLMLAVMTLNLGYFFAVLGGYFMGDLAFGRFIKTGDH